MVNSDGRAVWLRPIESHGNWPTRDQRSDRYSIIAMSGTVLEQNTFTKEHQRTTLVMLYHARGMHTARLTEDRSFHQR